MMKKIYNFYKVLLFTISVFVFTSCQNNEAEDLFDESVTVRFDKKIAELREELKSPDNGWISTYFPDDASLGGYTFLFDFTDDKKVVMASDLTTDLTTTTSEYNVNIGASVQLAFTSKGRIHELSDSDKGPFRGQGYRGAFEFTYYGKDGDDLIFRDVKKFKEVRFRRATAKDWNTTLSENRAMLDNIANDPNKSVFRNLVVEGDGETKKFTFSYNTNLRFGTTERVVDGEQENSNLGIAPTPTGLVISPALKVGDIELRDFTLNTTTGAFVAEKNGAKATIEYDTEPAGPLTPYDFGVIRNNGRFNFLEPAKSSTAFNDFYNTFVADLQTNASVEITRVYLRDLNSGEIPYLHIYTNIGLLTYDLSFEVVDGKVTFTHTGDTNMTAGLLSLMQPFIDVFVGSKEGYYIKGTGGLLTFTNGTFSLINADDTRYEINYYDF